MGAVARLARNFGADRLVLVASRAKVGTVARRRAMAGLPLLRTAARVKTFDEGVGDADFVIGTTDLSTGRSNAYLRRSVSPERLGEMVRTLEGHVAIVFGPEDNGLSREELLRCDLIVHIPARRDFRRSISPTRRRSSCTRSTGRADRATPRRLRPPR